MTLTPADYRDAAQAATAFARTDNPTRLEEIQQEARIALWQCSLRHDGRDLPLRDYARSRIRGAVRDYYRRTGTGRGTDERPQAGNRPFRLMIEQQDGNTPEPAYETASDARLEVGTLLTRLPARLAFVLSAYYLQGLDVYQIGRQLGVTQPRVSQLLREARQKAREALC